MNGNSRGTHFRNVAIACCSMLLVVSWASAKVEPGAFGKSPLPVKGQITPPGSDQESGSGIIARGGTPQCDGDTNGCGCVDPLSAGYILARFGLDVTESVEICNADVNCDGVIDPLDVGYVLARFGTCEEPLPCQLACPAPANDECADAASIACGGVAVVNNIRATENATDPLFSCKFGGPDIGFGTVWYSFVAEATAANLSTCNSAGSPDTVLAVYTGDCGSLTEIACNDDADCGPMGFNSEVTACGLVIGDTYLVQVSAWDGSAIGEITLEVDCEGLGGACCTGGTECAEGLCFVDCSAIGGAYQGDGTSCTGAGGICTPPANDDCFFPPEIFDGTTPFDNTDATDDGPADCAPDTGHQDLWFTYFVTASKPGALRISLCSDTDYDSTLSVYDNFGCPVGDPLACSDDDCGVGGGPSEVILGFDQISDGDNLLIRVGGWNNISNLAIPSGTGTITIDYVTGGDCCLIHAEPGCDFIDIPDVDPADVEACVCGVDPFCCETTWDIACVGYVMDVCGLTCPLCPSVGPHDECVCAAPVECGGTYTEDIADFSSGNDPVSSCETVGTFCPTGGGGPFTKDASWWYTITTGPTQTSLHLDFCDTPNVPRHDVVVSIWEASLTCDGLVDEAEFACDDDKCTCPTFGPSDLCATVAPNTTYLILVDHYSGACGPNDAGCFYTMNVGCDDGCSP